ncbi:hypothetical protein BHMPCIPO_06510 [Ensifer sesbaniae]|nr:hypothetical protein [Ensifer sesbaniae]
MNLWRRIGQICLDRTLCSRAVEQPLSFAAGGASLSSPTTCRSPPADGRDPVASIGGPSPLMKEFTMTTAMAAFRRRGELKPNDRGATTTRFVEREGSARMNNGVTVFGRSIPTPMHKRNCEGRVMVLGAKRSDKSAASTANLSQRMRLRSGQRRRTALSPRSAMQTTRGYIAPKVTYYATRRPMADGA